MKQLFRTPSWTSEAYWPFLSSPAETAFVPLTFDVTTQEESIWSIRRVSVLCSNYSPHGILIHPREDQCCGLLFGPLRRPEPFCYAHCWPMLRLCLFPSALPRPLQVRSQRATWRSPLVSTLLPIFPL